MQILCYCTTFQQISVLSGPACTFFSYTELMHVITAVAKHQYAVKQWKKKPALSENEKNWHRPIEAAKNVICLGRFGELPWSVLQLYCTCHHRRVDKQHSFSLYWISLRDWLEWVFHNCNCLFHSDHWSKSERMSIESRKKISLKMSFVKLDFHINAGCWLVLIVYHI